MPELRPYWQALRSQVCTRCLDGDGKGGCRIDPASRCTIEMHLPRILEVVTHVRSDAMEDYVRELRLITCAACAYQTVEGACMTREDIACQLDRYFPLVVTAIESVDKSSNHHSSSLRKKG